MAVTVSVQEFLRRSNVPYSVFRHVPAYSAQRDAEVARIPGRDWAKAVICFADGEPVQAVVPADRYVDLEKLGVLAGARTVRLAGEHELGWLFPDCERGAMPPLGPLYRQRVFVDASLAGELAIAFNAGTHTDAIAMRFDDFASIAFPIVGPIALELPQ